MTIGPITYLVGICFSFIEPAMTLVIYIVTLLFFIVNTTTGDLVQEKTKFTNNMSLLLARSSCCSRIDTEKPVIRTGK